MKICWDNLENLRYNPKINKWRDKHKHSFVYVDSCKCCGEPYLTFSSKKTDFCSYSCVSKGRNHTEESKKKMSKSRSGKNHHMYGKKYSEEARNNMSKVKRGKNNPMYGKLKEESSRWNGGYYSKNIPFFDTYAHQISYAEEVRRNPKDKNILQVKCSRCKKWYTPKVTDIQARIYSLNNSKGECKLYCSDECKQSCPIFGKHLYQVGHPKLDIERPYQSEWSKMVKERDEYQCVICGSTDGVIAHHIDPVKTHPHLQADVDNGITLCEKCHNERGHVGKCSTANLAKRMCY